MKKHGADKLDKLDRLLSERLTKALGDDKRADWLDVRERAGMTRTSWHWSPRRVLLLAGVLVLAVGACAGSTGVIPWMNKKPGPKAFVHLLPICAPKSVDAKLYLNRQKTSGNLTGLIVLANTGRTRCAVTGQAKVSLVGPAARTAHWRIELPESVFSPQRAQPQTELGMTSADRKGGASSVFLWWENWCGPGSGTNGYAGKPALKFEIANGSKFVLPVYKLPACSDVKKPSLLRVDRAASAPSPLYWKPSLPLRAEIVGIEKGAPFRLESGHVFRYRVALTNTNSSTYRFRDCPMYQERVLQAGDHGAFPLAYAMYVLNCRSVGEIEAGKTVTFAMELPVPKTAYSTKGVLTWVLAFDTKNPPTAKAPIAVEGVHYSPAAEYSVFAPGKPEATFPPRLQREAGFMRHAFGPIVKGSRRILLVNPGTVRTIMYAFVTESRTVCYGLLRLASSCDGGASQTSPLVWIAAGPSGGPRIIAGLARDRVKSVDVIVNGKPWPAKLANNAFYLEVPLDHKHMVTSIVATMKDGSQKKTGVGPLR